MEKEYNNLIKKFGSEFNVLLEVSPKEMEGTCLPEVVEGIIRMREGKVFREGGYDGVYGKIKVFSQGEQKAASRQDTLF